MNDAAAPLLPTPGRHSVNRAHEHDHDHDHDHDDDDDQQRNELFALEAQNDSEFARALCAVRRA